jgi:hypothetical protein
MPAPPISIPNPDVSREECDQCLGSFMRTWDLLELAVFNLFHKLVDTDIATALTLMHSGIDLRTLRNIIQQLGQNRLQTKDQAILTDILRRVDKAATKRNRIVHGAWMLELKMGPPPQPQPLTALSATWIRQYRPTDRRDFENLMRGKSQKLEAAYKFGPKQLGAAASQVEQIAKDIRKFSEALTFLPALDPQPVEW